MKGMTNLRETVAAAVMPECHHEPIPMRVADAALAALGLDDDTAARRLAAWLSGIHPYKDTHPENLLGHARRCIEHALSTEGEG